MSEPFLEYDLADFSNTNKEQKSLAEIRRDAYAEGFMCGKAEGRADAIEELLSGVKPFWFWNTDFDDNVITEFCLEQVAEQVKDGEK